MVFKKVRHIHKKKHEKEFNRKKIRTAKLDHEPLFNIGDQLIISTEKGHNGKKKISITNKQLHNFLKKGDIVFADDGTLKFTVKKVIKKDICIHVTL